MVAGIARLRRITAAAKERPLTTFVPSPSFRSMRDREHRLILARAANRVGKTRHACWVAAREAIELPSVKGRPVRIRIVGPNRAQVNGKTGEYLAHFLRGHLSDKSYYTPKGWNSNTVVLQNGSIIQLKSLEDDPQTHAGDELDLVIMDEPPKRAHFSENLSRIGSVSGRMIVVMTPVDRPVGWLREIVEAEGSSWVQLVAAFSRDNCPWYTEQQVAEHLDTMRSSAWQWAQRVEGAWEGVSEDRMLSGFTDDSVTHEDPSGEVSLGLTFDHGIKAGKTVSLLWASVGQWVWVLDEWIAESALTPEEASGHVVAMLKRRGQTLDDVDWAIGDVNVSGHTGFRVNAEMQAEFKRINGGRLRFRVRDPYKKGRSIDYGIRLLNYSFRRADLRVHSRCTKLVDACKHWQGGKAGDDGLLSDRIDALRYGALRLFAPRKPYAELRY